MKIDKAIDSMRHLLMQYASEMEYLTKEISRYANMSEHFEFEQLTKHIDEKVEAYAKLEQKSTVMKGFLTQMLTQIGTVPQQEPGQNA
jgi:hypothetical protein